jgi:hypothetical protein
LPVTLLRSWCCRSPELANFPRPTPPIARLRALNFRTSHLFRNRILTKFRGIHSSNNSVTGRWHSQRRSPFIKSAPSACKYCRRLFLRRRSRFSQGPRVNLLRPTLTRLGPKTPPCWAAPLRLPPRGLSLFDKDSPEKILYHQCSL